MNMMKSQKLPIFRSRVVREAKLLPMRWEVSMLPVNDYKSAELIRESIPEKYLLDEVGNCILATTFFNTESTIRQLIQFLFQIKEIPQEVYRDANNYILDLTPMKDRLINLNELESFYPTWLQITGRENTMNEYGMLIDFVGFARTENRCYLVMIVSNRSK
jgi:hypothetical protein